MKQNLRKLFLSYADFTNQASIYISHSKFLKLCEDCQVKLHPNELSILISTTLQLKASLIKSISFDQFLDLVQALS